MSKPLGSILDGSFFFFANGVLTNPTPLPTVTVCSKPDGTTVAPPALTNPAPGIFYAAQLFSATDTDALAGFYSAFAENSDASIDNPLYLVEWEVEAASGSIDVSSFSGAAETQIGTIENQTSRIGAGNWAVFSPTSRRGNVIVVDITPNDDYYPDDGRQIAFEVPSGLPDLTGASALLRLPKGNSYIQVTANTVNNSLISFTLPRSQSKQVTPGDYAVQITLVNGHEFTPLVGPVQLSGTLFSR